MTRLLQLAALVTVVTFVVGSPLAFSRFAEQDPAAAKELSKTEPHQDDPEEKKKIAEALKKAIDPKKAALLAEKAAQDAKDQKVDKAKAEEADKNAAELLEEKAFLPQFEAQIRPMVRSRYNFLKAVAQPTREQRSRIVRQAEEVQKKVAHQYAKMQVKMQHGQWNGDSKYPDGSQLLNDDFLKIARVELNPEQFKNFQMEMKHKAKSFQRVCIKNIVAQLDLQLILTSEQRDKLVDELNANWDSSWVQSLDIFMYGDQFAPKLPNERILPHLTPLQKEIWKGTPRNGGMVWGGFGFNWGNQNDVGPLDKDFPGEEPAKKAFETKGAAGIR